MTPYGNGLAVAFIVLAVMTWLGPRDEIKALTRLAGINPVAIDAGICVRHGTRCTVEPQLRHLAADPSVKPQYGYPAADLLVKPEDSYF